MGGRVSKCMCRRRQNKLVAKVIPGGEGVVCGKRRRIREGSGKRRRVREEGRERKYWRRGMEGDYLPRAIVTHHKDCTVIVIFIIAIFIIPAH